MKFRVRKMSRTLLMSATLLLGGISVGAEITAEELARVYEEVKTPYKYDPLAIGVAWTEYPTVSTPWTRHAAPILAPWNRAARPFEAKTLYKSFVSKDLVNWTKWPGPKLVEPSRRQSVLDWKRF